MAEILVCEEHSQVYDSWQERGQRNLAISHVDFHCDMSGLLLHRRRGEARFIDGTVPGVDKPHSGNFLAHAVLEGIVTSIRWVHHRRGGRKYDTGTVKHEYDLSAVVSRCRARRADLPVVPVQFDEMTFDRWDGVREGELLNIDWDGLASIEYPESLIDRLTADFLARDLGAVPATTYVAYSPGYSHPDRDRFEAFLSALAEKLGATVERMPDPPPRPGYPLPPQRLRGADRLKRAAVLAGHRVGIY
jgi:hypothetical protein